MSGAGLVGDGNLIALLVGIGPGTHTRAKGGVMIRDSLNGGLTSPDGKTWSQMVIVITPHVPGQDRTCPLDGIAASPCRGWGP